jgi:hypothetical protein
MRTMLQARVIAAGCCCCSCCVLSGGGAGCSACRGGVCVACAWGPTAEGDATVAFRGTLLVPGKELASGGCSGLGMAAARCPLPRHRI